MVEKVKLKLFIIGGSSRAKRAISHLEEIMENNFPGEYTLEIIDIMERPQLAEEKKIMATPTVIKERPQSVQKIIGDLSDEQQVLAGLDLETAVDSC